MRKTILIEDDCERLSSIFPNGDGYGMSFENSFSGGGMGESREKHPLRYKNRTGNGYLYYIPNTIVGLYLKDYARQW